MSVPVIIIGAGGHATVLADALLTEGRPVIGFTDPDVALHGTTVCGLPVLGDDDATLAQYSPGCAMLVNGLGGTDGTAKRRQVQQRLESSGWCFASVRHPSALVSRFACIGEGTQILAASVVQAGARIGNGCIVNTAGVVEHDCQVGEQVHLAPRALLCGHVAVGAHSHIGAGAVVLQGVALGPQTLVAAGAVVVASFEGHGMLVGVPARRRGEAA